MKKVEFVGYAARMEKRSSIREREPFKELKRKWGDIIQICVL
jgi:hypothetical protein